MALATSRDGDASPQTIVYVANADSHDISILILGEETSFLAPLETAPAGGRVMPLAISPDQRYLYAGLRSEPYTVVTFSIAPESGRLQPLGAAPLADNFCYLSTDRTGRFLFGASYSGSQFSVNVIHPDGEVDPIPLAVISTGKNAHAIAPDPTNRFLFVTNLGDDQILHYRFDAASGDVTPNEPPLVKTEPGAGPRHFVFHPEQPLVFCLNELHGSVTSYRLEETGTLTPIASTSVLPADFAGKPWAADIHLSPDGRFLYTSERTSSTLAAFRVDSELGGLSPIGHYATERQPRSFQIDPAGRRLFAAGETSDGVSVYAIDGESGDLHMRSRLGVGTGPNWVEVMTLAGVL
jgi:6-phosphogluconolactonase